MPVWPQNAAILAGSRSPAAAKLFLGWLLEPDQQNAIAQGGAWSPRLDIAPPPGLAPLAELNIANGFLAFITRTADAQAYPGPVRGAHQASHRPGTPLIPTPSPGPSACRRARASRPPGRWQ